MSTSNFDYDSLSVKGQSTPFTPPRFLPDRSNDTSLLEQVNVSVREMNVRIKTLLAKTHGNKVSRAQLEPVLEAMAAFKLALALNGIGVPNGDLLDDPYIRGKLNELRTIESNRAQSAAAKTVNSAGRTIRQDVAQFSMRNRFTK